MTDLTWKAGDWAIHDRSIVQIKEIRDGGGCSVSDGSFETSGNLLPRLRPLTLRNKRAAEWFDWHYNELRKINGERGFNYPDIHRLFSQLTLQAIDGAEDDKEPYEAAQEFVRLARDYVPVIRGVALFRSAA